MLEQVPKTSDCEGAHCPHGVHQQDLSSVPTSSSVPTAEQSLKRPCFQPGQEPSTLLQSFWGCIPSISGQGWGCARNREYLQVCPNFQASRCLTRECSSSVHTNVKWLPWGIGEIWQVGTEQRPWHGPASLDSRKRTLRRKVGLPLAGTAWD